MPSTHDGRLPHRANSGEGWALFPPGVAGGQAQGRLSGVGLAQAIDKAACLPRAFPLSLAPSFMVLFLSFLSSGCFSPLSLSCSILFSHPLPPMWFIFGPGQEPD